MIIGNRLYKCGALATAVWIALSATTAHAHGGIAGPDELGPPVIISTVIGIACYWAMVLWPRRQGRNVHRIDRVARRASR
jgi:hypothetical protein